MIAREREWEREDAGVKFMVKKKKRSKQERRNSSNLPANNLTNKERIKMPDWEDQLVDIEALRSRIPKNTALSVKSHPERTKLRKILNAFKTVIVNYPKKDMGLGAWSLNFQKG